jgi:3-O-methylgallate 3,4-dioxygenase
MGSSHGPMLSTPPEEWGQRVLADKKNKEHYYKSRTWTFDQLVEARKSENLGKQIELPVWRERHAACRKALGQLAAVFAEVKPDVAVIVGNDQKEIFRDAYTPAISVFYGKTIVNTMFSDERIAALPPGIAIAIPGHIPPGGATYPGAPELGQHIVKSLVADEFDVSTLTELPHDRRRTRSASSIGRSCSTRRYRASPSSSTRSIRPISRACGAAMTSASRW